MHRAGRHDICFLPLVLGPVIEPAERVNVSVFFRSKILDLTCSIARVRFL